MRMRVSIQSSRPIHRSILPLLLAGLCACTAVNPPVETPAQAPPLVLKQRVLSADAEDRVLQAALDEYRDDAAVHALIENVRLHSSEPLTAGNDVQVLIDGPQTFAAFEQAMRAARHHIHVEMFIFGADAVGQRFVDVLLQKHREGVAVRVLYDAIGSMDSPPEFFDQLRDAGIDVREFRPMNPVKTPQVWKLHNRDHRKIVVVDGRVGFTGGINIDDTYSSGSISRPGPKQGLTDGWRDTQVRIEGPAVRQLQTLFQKTWNEVGERTAFEPRQEYFPAIRQPGDDLVTIVANDSDDDDRSLYGVHLAAFRHAHTRLWITNAYFAPNDALLEALLDAVKRGVDVRLMVPGFSDSNIVLQAARATYTRLLEGGVHIYQLDSALLHAKSAVIDGCLAIVGSANLDMRSFVHNDEANAVVVSRDVARRLEEVFERDRAAAHEVQLAEWNKRSAWQRLKEWYARAVGYWL